MLIINAEEALFQPGYRNKQKTYMAENTDQRILTYKHVFFSEDAFKMYDLYQYLCTDLTDEDLGTLIGVHDSDEYKHTMWTRIGNLTEEKRLSPVEVTTANKNIIPASLNIKYEDYKQANLDVTASLQQAYALEDGKYLVSNIRMNYTGAALAHAKQGTAVPQFSSIQAVAKTGDTIHDGTFYYDENGVPKSYNEKGMWMSFDEKTGLYSSISLETKVTPDNQKDLSDRVANFSTEAAALYSTANTLYPALKKQVHLHLN